MRIICYNKTGTGICDNSKNYGKLRGPKQFTTFCKYNASTIRMNKCIAFKNIEQNLFL